MLPNLSDLLLWGIPAVTFVAAFVAFLKGTFPSLKEAVVQLIGNLLFFILALVILSQERWSGLYPEVEMWAKLVFWAIALTLIRMGHYPAIVRRFAARYL